MEIFTVILMVVAVVVNLLAVIFGFNILFNLGNWHKRQIDLLEEILKTLRRGNATQERSAIAMEKTVEALPEENLDDLLDKRIGKK